MVKKSIQTSKPLVSILITCYNYDKFVGQAIESSLNQTYDNIEIIVVDDKSDDNSLDIIKKYSNKIKIIKHKENKGVVFSRNELIRESKGDFFIFLDADNYFSPDNISKTVDFIIKNNLDVVYHDMITVSGDKEVGEIIYPEYNIERLKNHNYIDSCSMVRKSTLGDVEFDKKLDKLTHEDWDFFLHLGLRGAKIEKNWENKFYYRVKPGSRNLSPSDSDNSNVHYAELYEYIYKKYEKLFPEEFNYLAYYGFLKKYQAMFERFRVEKEEKDELKIQNQTLKIGINSILNSKSYKIGKIFTIPTKIIRKIKNIKHIFVKNIKNSKVFYNMEKFAYLRNNKKSSSEIYFIKNEAVNLKKRIAVVLHLYYTDDWEEIFLPKIKKVINSMDADLVVSMPEKNYDFAPTIKESFKDVKIFITPNKGRDVLPFIKVAKILHKNGYKKVLKIHSKKSSHRENAFTGAEEGNVWLRNILNNLIPENDQQFKIIIDKIQDEETGLIGPGNYYYPFKMYLKNNLRRIKMIIDEVDDEFLSGYISEKLDNYGYFGGTMFWVDLDSIKEVFMVSKDNFQKEKGQIDGTIAHAFERIFCALPSIKNKKIYSINENSFNEVSNRNFIKPEWYLKDISGGKPKVSIIVPVYADWETLKLNIESLKKYLGNSEEYSIYYINDCGPESEFLENKIMENISGMTNFYYYKNPKNVGFVKSCNNAAFNVVDKDTDILLLNSDTKVTEGFAREMKAVLYSEKTIAAVTARSNNATIWSVPMSSKLANKPNASYFLYKILKYKIPEKYITPTVHGFCCLIRRDAIDKYGLFDEIYGLGYAEENDFAMRLRSHGLKCAVSNRSFVFHYESKSFGDEKRREQIKKNEKILLDRYHEYTSLIQEYWNNTKELLK